MEGKGNQDGEVLEGRISQCCIKCSEWEDKYKQAEQRFTELKSEFEVKISELGSLQCRFGDLEVEKLALHDEVESLRKRNKDLEERITYPGSGNIPVDDVRERAEDVVDLTEDKGENKVLELMIENRVLQCEKNTAESEVQMWKSKCNELECRVMELEQRLPSGGRECVSTGLKEVGREEINVGKALQGRSNDAATPFVDTSCRDFTRQEEGKAGIVSKNKLQYGSRARKRLFSGEESSFIKNIAPTTPAGIRPASFNVIDISDSDGESDGAEGSGKAFESTDYRGKISPDEKQFPSEISNGALDQSVEDDVTCHNEIAPDMSTRKRKRAANVVSSDSERDTDDHFPLSRLRKNSKTDAASSRDIDDAPVVRRRLVTLRNLKGDGTSEKSFLTNSKGTKAGRLRGIPTSKISKDNEETGEDESDTEGGSLSDFIVSDSDISGADYVSGGDEAISDRSHSSDESLGESGDESEGHIGYADVMSRIGRRKEQKSKWEFQADMQAAFGKDPELCMKAVCALYRQQTSDEKMQKATIVRNKRGFNQSDARRGTQLGEFLTGGDPVGELKKSVQELVGYDCKGVETCRTLALQYSFQLFQISQSGEDPLWP